MKINYIESQFLLRKLHHFDLMCCVSLNDKMLAATYNMLTLCGHPSSDLNQQKSIFPVNVWNSSMEPFHGNGLKKNNMGVSKNRGIPKSSILIGISIINHPFWGTPIFGNSHMHEYWYHLNSGKKQLLTLSLYGLPSLKLTFASLHLEMDGWNTFSFPFGAFRPIFRGVCC